MDVILSTGFSAISHSIAFTGQSVKKGKALAVSHVRRVEEVKGNEKVCGMIRGHVIRQTSVNLHPYVVKLEINDNRKVTHVHCTCVAQAGGQCKHVYALIHYVNNDRSCSKTSVEQEWGKPSTSKMGKEMYAKGIVITDHFKTKQKPKKPNVLPYALKLTDFGNEPCSLHTIVREASRTEGERFCRDLLGGCLEKAVDISGKRSCEVCVMILFNFLKESEHYACENNFVDTQMGNFYYKFISLSEAEISVLCIRTEPQSDCPEWFHARKLRISASKKAHQIKIRKKKEISQLVADFLNPPHSIQSKAVEYGLREETVALNEYERLFNVNVYHIGLFVSPTQPWLCASPDGIVVEGGCVTKLLEIKCPFSCKSKPVFDTSDGCFNVPYLHIADGNTELKASHIYYTQCQVQMYVTGLNVCDLFVWSPKGSYTVPVHRNDSFLKELLPKLHNFYFTHYLAALCNLDKENDSGRGNIHSDINNNNKFVP